MPRSSALRALAALFVPQLLAGLVNPAVRAVPALHGTPWGVAFFVSLAAPLWLGLLAALQLVPDEMPRAVAGASIAGIGAACLILPGDAYTVGPNQIPVAALYVLLGVLTVFSWSYARPRLAGTGTAAAAGCFLLLTALSQIALRPILARDLPVPLGWRDAMLPLLLSALVSAASWWLWFWLLERMTLAAFGMRALAAWLASLLPGLLMFGFLSWRVDAAAAIGMAALVVALRARTADEQPLALGLADS
jgi:drug/metabolite transporter (DMT)-like permease